MCRPIYFKYSVSRIASAEDKVKIVNDLIEQTLLKLSFTKVSDGVFKSYFGDSKKDTARDMQVNYATLLVKEYAKKEKENGIDIDFETARSA